MAIGDNEDGHNPQEPGQNEHDVHNDDEDGHDDNTDSQMSITTLEQLEKTDDYDDFKAIQADRCFNTDREVILKHRPKSFTEDQDFSKLKSLLHWSQGKQCLDMRRPASRARVNGQSRSKVAKLNSTNRTGRRMSRRQQNSAQQRSAITRKQICPGKPMIPTKRDIEEILDVNRKLSAMKNERGCDSRHRYQKRLYIEVPRQAPFIGAVGFDPDADGYPCEICGERPYEDICVGCGVAFCGRARCADHGCGRIRKTFN